MNALVNTGAVFQCRAEGRGSWRRDVNRSMFLALKSTGPCSILFCKLLDRRIWTSHLTSLGLFACLQNGIVTLIRVDARTKLDANIKFLSQWLPWRYHYSFQWPHAGYVTHFLPRPPQSCIWSSEFAHSLWEHCVIHFSINISYCMRIEKKDQKEQKRVGYGESVDLWLRISLPELHATYHNVLL